MEKTDYRLTRVSVVMLGVQDVRRSLGFYRDKLGLEVQHEIPGFAFLNAGGVTLCLSEPAAKMRGQVAGAGEVVFSVEEVTAAYQGLRGEEWNSLTNHEASRPPPGSPTSTTLTGTTSPFLGLNRKEEKC